MAGLINRRGLGTQPASSGVSMAGRHNRGGGPRHIGGGGGGGGGGRNRLPNTGLYHGRAGEAAANQNPEQYLRTAVSRLGGLNYSGTPIGDYSELFVQKLWDDYNAAMAGKQRLSPIDYMKNTYGAGFGKKGRTFNPGSLVGPGGALEAAYQNYYSNTNTPDYVTGQLGQQGGFVPGGGNADFDRFMQEIFTPRITAETATARAADPNVNVNEMLAGRDLIGQARRQYLARAQRQPGPVNLGARYSWWE